MNNNVEAIGRFYLRGAIQAASETQGPKDSKPFERIQMKLARGSNLLIPDELIRPFKLDHMRWQRAESAVRWKNKEGDQEPESLSILYLGDGKDSLDESQLYPQRAETTIEIARRAIIYRRLYDPEKDDYNVAARFFPFYLRIAGIDKISGRIVAATYDLEDEGRLKEVNVSLTTAERGDYHILHPREEEEETFTVHIPTAQNREYQTAGYITPKMQTVASNATAAQGFGEQRHALVVQRRSYDTFGFGKAALLRDFDRFAQRAHDNGFFLGETGGQLTIVHTPSINSDFETSAWEITVPIALKKTAA